MTEAEQLIAELRRYMAFDMPTDLALLALNHAMAERPAVQAGDFDWLASDD